MSKAKLTKTEKEIQKNFRTFGGGQYTEGNPVSIALADSELQFAAGVSVKDVIDKVLACNNHDVLMKICNSAKCALRSYQYGNGSPDLAEEIADDIESVLDKIKGEK